MKLPSPQEQQGQIAERQRAESEVRRLNAELEMRVSDRTGALKIANCCSPRARGAAQWHSKLPRWEHGPGTYARILLVWDDRCRAIFGLSQDEPVTYDRFRESIHPDDRMRVEAAVATALRDGSQYATEFYVVWPDGSTHMISVQGRADGFSEGVPGGMHGIAMDVSERKLMESEALRHAEIVESSDDAIISEDLTGAVTTWNKGAERLFGYRLKKFSASTSASWRPPSGYVESTGIVDQVRNGGRISSFETIRRRKDGNDVAISLSVSPMFSKAGSVVGISKIARDITLRKQMDQALRTSEELFRTVAEAVPDMLFSASPDGSIKYMSSHFQEYTGLKETPSLIFGQPFYIPEDIPPWHRALQTGSDGRRKCLSGVAMARFAGLLLGLSRCEENQERSVNGLALAPISIS